MGVVVGTETPNPKGKPYNSALVIYSTGAILALHNKSKLTPVHARTRRDTRRAMARPCYAFHLQGRSHGRRYLFRGVPLPVYPPVKPGGARACPCLHNGAKVVFHPRLHSATMSCRRWRGSSPFTRRSSWRKPPGLTGGERTPSGSCPRMREHEPPEYPPV